MIASCDGSEQDDLKRITGGHEVGDHFRDPLLDRAAVVADLAVDDLRGDLSHCNEVTHARTTNSFGACLLIPC